MLTREQLQDAATCMGKICNECEMAKRSDMCESLCTEIAAKTALELMDEVDRLREIIFAR